MRDKINFFVVIINWNGKNMTLECIDSVFKHRPKSQNLSVVLVDNNSSDDSVAAFKKVKKPYKLIVNDSNLGWSGGHNVGIKYALEHKADCIMLLANDAILYDHTFDRLIEKLYSQNDIGIVGPKVYKYGSKLPIIINAGGKLTQNRYFGIDIGNNEKDKGQFDHLSECDFVAGTAITIKREVFGKIGLLNEDLFIYYEDVDFCLRARKTGYKCVNVQDAIIYHRGGATTKIGSALHTYYTARNHLLVVEKHAPLKVKLREYLRIPKTVYQLSKSNNKIYKKYTLLGIGDYYLRRFGKRTYW